MAHITSSVRQATIAQTSWLSIQLKLYLITLPWQSILYTNCLFLSSDFIGSKSPNFLGRLRRDLGRPVFCKAKQRLFASFSGKEEDRKAVPLVYVSFLAMFSSNRSRVGFAGIMYKSVFCNATQNKAFWFPPEKEYD